MKERYLKIQSATNGDVWISFIEKINGKECDTFKRRLYRVDSVNRLMLWQGDWARTGKLPHDALKIDDN